MNTLEVKTNDPIIKNICKLLRYKKRSVYIVLGESPKNKTLKSYWDGGSRDYYHIYNIAENKISTMGSNHPFFESDKPSVLPFLPSGYLLIETGIFCGKPSMMRIYSNIEDRTKLIESRGE